MKQRESEKLKESVKNAQPEPSDHHQSRYSHTFNRQCRAKLGLSSAQRTQLNINTVYSGLIWPFSILRDEQPF